MKYISKLIFVLLLVAGITACSDYLEPSTDQNKPIETIKSVKDLQGLMYGAYSTLSSTNLYGRDYVVLGDVRTGNAFTNGKSGRFIEESLFQNTVNGSLGIWNDAYAVIRNCNVVISSELTADGAAQVKGEAYAMRALAHMILLKMYGQEFVDDSDLGVPYVTTFGEKDKFFPSRLSVDETLANIEADYQKALTLLDPTINDDITQMTYYAAKALLARFYLFSGNYSAAASTAKEIIDSGEYSLISAGDYVTAWAGDGGPSVLFEAAMTTTDNRGSGSIWQILTGNSYGDIEVTQELYQLFGTNDVRSGLYGTEITDFDKGLARTNYRVTGKFADRYKNTPIIRYAEVILIYAEAKARPGAQQNAVEAKTYLDMITSYRNAASYPAATVDNIMAERRKEFAMEGLYYWQLLRTGQGITREGMRAVVSQNEITVPLGDHRLAYPIPKQEMDANPNMDQNEGYTGS